MTLLHPRGNVPADPYAGSPRPVGQWRHLDEVIAAENIAVDKARAEWEASEPTCSCCWVGHHETIGDAVPHLQPCAGHSVYGDWRVKQARAEWEVRELARQRDEAVAHGEREPSIVVPTATWLEMVKEQDALSKTMRDLNDGCVELRAEAEREKARADKAEATLRAQLAETKTQATAPDDGHPAMAPAYPGAPPVYGPLRARPLTAVVHKIAA